MSKEYWQELNQMFIDNEKLASEHKELSETINLICKSIELSNELDEINKKLQNKEGK